MPPSYALSILCSAAGLADDGIAAAKPSTTLREFEYCEPFKRISTQKELKADGNTLLAAATRVPSIQRRERPTTESEPHSKRHKQGTHVETSTNWNNTPPKPDAQPAATKGVDIDLPKRESKVTALRGPEGRVRHDYKPSKAHKALGVIQDYICGYCGIHRTSASACSDGRVRIRCECGGLRQDNVPRIHAHWKPLSGVRIHRSNGPGNCVPMMESLQGDDNNLRAGTSLNDRRCQFYGTYRVAASRMTENHWLTQQWLHEADPAIKMHQQQQSRANGQTMQRNSLPMAHAQLNTRALAQAHAQLNTSALAQAHAQLRQVQANTKALANAQAHVTQANAHTLAHNGGKNRLFTFRDFARLMFTQIM